MHNYNYKCINMSSKVEVATNMTLIGTKIDIEYYNGMDTPNFMTIIRKICR